MTGRRNSIMDGNYCRWRAVLDRVIKESFLEEVVFKER